MQTADRSGPIIEPGTKVGTVDRAGHLGKVKQRVRARSHNMAMELKSCIGELPTALTMQRAFREFDENGNGTLELAELQFGMRRLGVDVDDEALQSMFSVLDSDGDGHVQYAEFAQWFGAGPPPAPPPLEAHAHAEQIAAAGGAMGGELQQEIEIAADKVKIEIDVFSSFCKRGAHVPGLVIMRGRQTLPAHRLGCVLFRGPRFVQPDAYEPLRATRTACGHPTSNNRTW